MSALVLSGDANVPAMPLKDSEVNHLRRLLAWMRCEYMLDEHMQRGFLKGAIAAAEYGHDGETVVMQQVAKIKECPLYVRQAVKMLAAAIAAHEKRSGVVEGAP